MALSLITKYILAMLNHHTLHLTHQIRQPIAVTLTETKKTMWWYLSSAQILNNN